MFEIEADNVLKKI